MRVRVILWCGVAAVVVIGSVAILTVGSPSIAWAANWGTFQNDNCRALGIRQFSSRLWNISGSWEQACASTPATVSGQFFSSPSRCINKGAFGMWGEFDISDATCGATWGAFQRDACTGLGKRQFSSRIENVPSTVSWQDACAGTPASIQSQSFAGPDRCINKGPFGMWGEFDVSDASCAPSWGRFQKDACSGTGKRQFSSRIENLPPGVTWESACNTTPATIDGQPFAKPDRCVNKGVFGMWGEFDVPDASCVPAPSPGPLPDSRLAYAKQCEAEMGPIPTFNCLDGDIIPVTKSGVPITQMPSPDPDDCDKPVQLGLSGGEGQCVPYARFQRLTPNNPDVETVVICRKYHFTSGPDDPTFHDIALIQHHKTTGATCYFQSPVDTQPFLDGTHVPSPQEDSATGRRYWLEPQRSARSSGPGAIRCTGCHDADPFIWSPYIIQVAHPENWNPLGAWDSNFQSLFGSPVSTFRPDTNRCTTCHRFGSEICKKDDAGVGHVSVQEAATNLWMPPGFAGSAQEWNSTFAADLQKIFDCCANLQLAVCHTREATGH